MAFLHARRDSNLGLQDALIRGTDGSVPTTLVQGFDRLHRCLVAFAMIHLAKANSFGGGRAEIIVVARSGFVDGGILIDDLIRTVHGTRIDRGRRRFLLLLFL